MSIYASTFDFGWEHKLTCAQLRKIRPKVYEQDESKPCTCGSSPLLYQGSHILPSDSDTTGGTFGIAAIPGHISRPGRKALSDDMLPYHPWLRVSFDGLQDDAIVLTRDQVLRLYLALADWLAYSVPQTRRQGVRAGTPKTKRKRKNPKQKREPSGSQE